MRYSIILRNTPLVVYIRETMILRSVMQLDNAVVAQSPLRCVSSSSSPAAGPSGVINLRS